MTTTAAAADGDEERRIEKAAQQPPADWTPFESGGGFISFLEPKTEEDRATMARALIGSADRVADLINTEVVITNVIAQKVQFAIETGELIDGVRIILVLTGGAVCAAVGTGVLNSLRTIFGIYGYPAKWKAPLRVRIEQTKTRNGFSTQVLMPLGWAVPPAAKK